MLILWTNKILYSVFCIPAGKYRLWFYETMPELQYWTSWSNSITTVKVILGKDVLWKAWQVSTITLSSRYFVIEDATGSENLCLFILASMYLRKCRIASVKILLIKLTCTLLNCIAGRGRVLTTVRTQLARRLPRQVLVLTVSALNARFCWRVVVPSTLTFLYSQIITRTPRC